MSITQKIFTTTVNNYQKLCTATVNKATYSHAMLIKIVMLTKISFLIWYRTFSEFSLAFLGYQMRVGAGITPLQSPFSNILYLVENNLVNIMLDIWYILAKAFGVISYCIWATSNVLFVTCYGLLGLASYIDIYNALGVYHNACSVYGNGDFDNINQAIKL